MLHASSGTILEGWLFVSHDVSHTLCRVTTHNQSHAFDHKPVLDICVILACSMAVLRSFHGDFESLIDFEAFLPAYLAMLCQVQPDS